MLKIESGLPVRETFTILRLVNYIIPSRDSKLIACVYNTLPKNEKATLAVEINKARD